MYLLVILLPCMCWPFKLRAFLDKEAFQRYFAWFYVVFTTLKAVEDQGSFPHLQAKLRLMRSKRVLSNEVQELQQSANCSMAAV